MLQPACLVPGLENTVRFTNGLSFIRLLDGDGAILLNLRIAVPDGKIFINDQVDQQWRERREILLPAPEAEDYLRLNFALNQEHLELWNSHERVAFLRFTHATADRVRYCVLKNAFDDSETVISLVLRPEEMAAEIASQIAMGRTDLLEAKLDGFIKAQTEAKG